MQQIRQTPALQDSAPVQREPGTGKSISKRELRSGFVMVCPITSFFNQEYVSETYLKK